MGYNENDFDDDAYTDVLGNPAPEWLTLELPHRVPSYWLDPIIDFMSVAVAILEPDAPETAIVRVERTKQCLQFTVELDPRLDRAQDVKALLAAAQAFKCLSEKIVSLHRALASQDTGASDGVEELNSPAKGCKQAPMVSHSDGNESEYLEKTLSPVKAKYVSVFSWKVDGRDDGGIKIGRDAESAKRMQHTIQELKRTGPTRPLCPPPTDWRDKVDSLVAKFPNFKSVVQVVVRPHLAMMEKNGTHRHSPVLLVGRPGIGKTYFANALANTFGLQGAMFISLASETNGSSLGGSSTFWSNSSPGKLFETLAWGDGRGTPPANPLVVLDEIDKVEVERYNPLGALYTLLEEETAATFSDASLTDLVICASHVRFVATANDITKVPEPLLSRMFVCHIDPPSPEQLRGVILAIYQSLVDRLNFPLPHSLPEEVVQAALMLSPREAKVRIECAIASAISEGRDCVQLTDWPDVPTASQQVTRRSIGFTV